MVQARNIYLATGKAIWPWEVGQVPSDYFEAMQMYATKYHDYYAQLRKDRPDGN